MSRPFAVPSELVTYGESAGLEISEDAARLSLALASAAVRTFVGWRLSAGRTVAKRVRALTPGARCLWLPTLHLRGIVSLAPVVLGQPLPPLVENVGFTWEEEGRVDLLWRGGAATWGGAFQSGATFVATYDDGYLEDHPAIDTAKGVCLAAAARLCDNPTSVRSLSETTGGETTATVSAGAGDDVISLLARGERKQLEPYQLPVLG